MLYVAQCTTMEKYIQCLSKIAVLEVIYSEMDDKQVSKDPVMWSTWWKFVQSRPVAAMDWKDEEEPTVDVVVSQFFQYEYLLSLLWACSSVVEKLSQWVQQLEEHRFSSSPIWTSTSAMRYLRDSAFLLKGKDTVDAHHIAPCGFI